MDKVKNLITEFAPPFAGYTEYVPEITPWELECDSARIQKSKMLFLIVNLLDEDFSDEKVAEDVADFRRHLLRWITKYKNIHFRVIIPEDARWSHVGHSELRSEFVCLEGREKEVCYES